MAKIKHSNEKQTELIPLARIPSERRHFSHTPVPSNDFILTYTSGNRLAVAEVRKRRITSDQINFHHRAMQLNASPTLTNVAAPTLNRDHWQQRRYNFLSKNSMLGGELKDDVVHEQASDVEQRPIMGVPQVIVPSSTDSEGFNVKRESVLGMAVTGVRNLLAEDNGDEQSRNSETSAKTVLLLKKENDESVGSDEVDAKQSIHCTQFTQTDDEILSTEKIIYRSNKKCPPLNKLSPRGKAHLKNLVQFQQSYRPYFTYWVTLVQILVCIVSLIVYGYAPLATTQNNNSSFFGQQRFDLTINPWFGPYPADLIRLGAKYTPCMRRHDEVENRYKKQSMLESMSGCCIDSSTDRCMQTLPQQCLSRSGLAWHRLPLEEKNSDEKHRSIYPAVCGFTPETCTKTLNENRPREDDSSWSSTYVDSKIFKWSPNAAKWPICLEQDHNRIANNISLYPYMQCTNIARPCCTGVLGDCVLTSQDDCRRRRGIFHPRAFLCSQVDCIQSVCGMLEFFVVRIPDQVYRFWTVIFIHAGLIHLAITIIFQYTIMRPLEKLAGCIRVMIIYIVSGFIGSLASALFLRDSIQVGPGGGQLAILACYLSELFLGWRSLKRPWIPFFKIIVCLIILLTVGLLPLVDNYSQCFGFIIGFMLNMIVFPDVNFRKNVRRLVVITVSLSITIALFISLIVLFYTVPFKCASCKLFSCPFGKICGEEKRDLM